MAAGRLMSMQKVVLMMIMVVAVMQLQVPMVQTRHLITTSSSTAVAAPPAPAPVSISRSSSGGGGPVTYMVGDSFGWAIPGGATTYSTWASDKNFSVGDILVFIFANQAHTGAEVTRTTFDSCSSETTTTMEASYLHSPAMITLTRPGSHYVICTIGQCCSLGQKLAINVTRGSSSTPPASSSTNAIPPSTSPTPSADSITNTPPPTVPSSAPSSMMDIFLVVLFFIALAAFLSYSLLHG